MKVTMSNYAGAEPEYIHQHPGDLDFQRSDGEASRKLMGGMASASKELETVSRLAELSVEGSVQARADLAVLMRLDLNFDVFREGVVNRRGSTIRNGVVRSRSNISSVDSNECKLELVEDARTARELGDTVSWIAYAALAGFYPPEKSDVIRRSIDPDYDSKHDFRTSMTGDSRPLGHNSG